MSSLLLWRLFGRRFFFFTLFRNWGSFSFFFFLFFLLLFQFFLLSFNGFQFGFLFFFYSLLFSFLFKLLLFSFLFDLFNLLHLSFIDLFHSLFLLGFKIEGATRLIIFVNFKCLSHSLLLFLFFKGFLVRVHLTFKF